MASIPLIGRVIDARLCTSPELLSAADRVREGRGPVVAWSRKGARRFRSWPRAHRWLAGLR